MSDRESYSEYDDPAPVDAREEIARLREDAEAAARAAWDAAWDAQAAAGATAVAAGATAGAAWAARAAAWDAARKDFNKLIRDTK